jgi:serine/threonine protein kinase
LEDSEGVHALVLQLVEGPTLADRIAQGPISIDEALRIVRQIAEALEAAHEKGIIHRDLKPANVKVTADGQVKVLDFGLAKLLDPAVSGQAPTYSSGLTDSPTITTPATTLAGVILGTAAYMSPEQARGQPVDKRTDIWAFGCVLYEMLQGAQRSVAAPSPTHSLPFSITTRIGTRCLRPLHHRFNGFCGARSQRTPRIVRGISVISGSQSRTALPNMALPRRRSL